MYAETRSDDMVVAVIRELLRRHPELPPERIDEVAIAADHPDRRPGPDDRPQRGHPGRAADERAGLRDRPDVLPGR
jgi:hypothetical protein